jgi:hypothetical protein
MSNIKVGYLISYDYEFVKNSIPRVYDHVNQIVFAVDADRLTWSGQSFEISADFWSWIKAFDKDKKIKIYEDHFYVPDLTPMQCDTRERNMLGKEMGSCDWYVQIDSDEYFIDFKTFADKLHAFKPKEPTTIHCNVATLFKQVDSGYLIIGESVETLSFATNSPVYDLARNNKSGNKYVYWEDLVLHQSWARTPEEIYLKLNNWSHKDDFNTQSFYNLWSAIDEFNFYGLKNFHPLDPITWPRLKFIKGNIGEILNSAAIKLVNQPEPSQEKIKPLLSRLWKEIKRSF